MEDQVLTRVEFDLSNLLLLESQDTTCIELRSRALAITLHVGE